MDLSAISTEDLCKEIQKRKDLDLSVNVSESVCDYKLIQKVRIYTWEDGYTKGLSIAPLNLNRSDYQFQWCVDFLINDNEHISMNVDQYNSDGNMLCGMSIELMNDRRFLNDKEHSKPYKIIRH